MKKIIAMIAAALVCFGARADEGMWLLPLLEQINGKALADAGCRLTPDEIYSINHSSLKDAIVHFGGGCTGEIISRDGLLVTNHHCGYSSIQGLSTPEHNYLMDGYWAMNRAGELPVDGLTVTFLVSMEDVTAKLEGLEDPNPVRRELRKAAEEANPGCHAQITSFYNNNVYYLIVYKTYADVRFVGAPPASVGKFGGETDNWMWPRHTGDFSMFRVYMAPDGSPESYSEENVPLSAERHLKVSLKGVQKGDYTMILGYPGRTQRFQTAAQLKQMIEVQRIAVDARTVRQDIMWEAMCADPEVQLKYANKYASSANGWKKWQGEELAFGKLGIIDREEEKEAAFMKWVNKKKTRKALYGDALEGIASRVEASDEAQKAMRLVMEAPWRIELVGILSAISNYNRRFPGASVRSALEQIKGVYRDYVPELDRKEAVALLKFYRERAQEKDYLNDLGGGFDDFALIDIEAYVNYLFDNSFFVDYEAADKALAADPDAFFNDPVTRLYASIFNVYRSRLTEYNNAVDGLDEVVKAYTAGLMEWQKKEPSYPDANSTMRLTYGHVLPYNPKDAVQYSYFTTLDGVMQKEDPTNPEFIVPAKLRALWEAKDFGRYADSADGKVHTCFLTNNDITGGNSGSPVLDADGNLIGLAFDGNWESMSSDVMFEPDLQRCICVDIRYVLFLVDKLGGASHLIDELDFAE